MEFRKLLNFLQQVFTLGSNSPTTPGRLLIKHLSDGSRRRE